MVSESHIISHIVKNSKTTLSIRTKRYSIRSWRGWTLKFLKSDESHWKWAWLPSKKKKKKKVMLYYCSTQKQHLGNIKNLVSLIWLTVCTQGSVIHLFISVCLIVPVNLLTTTLWGSEHTYLALVTVGRIVTASSVNALSTVQVHLI